MHKLPFRIERMIRVGCLSPSRDSLEFGGTKKFGEIKIHTDKNNARAQEQIYGKLTWFRSIALLG